MTKATVSRNKLNSVDLTEKPGDDRGELLAQAMLGQNLRHGQLAANFAGRALVGTNDKLALMDCAKVIQSRTTDAIAGDLSFASAMLASQAVSLDSMFTEFARIALLNMAEYPDAMERYVRLAMKAQVNSRATLEALAKMHQTREQTVKHVHVNEGGQAIVTDQFHHHGGIENGKSINQPHAPESAAASGGASMRSTDANRDTMPIPRDA
jgi:hypothetical protein